MLLKNKIKLLPEKVGVYFFLDKNEKMLYVGKSKNIKKRVGFYFNKKTKKNNLIINGSCFVDYILVESEEDALFLENSLIKKHQPNTLITLSADYSYTAKNLILAVKNVSVTLIAQFTCMDFGVTLIA